MTIIQQLTTRQILGHRTAVSDTDSTDEDEKVGGAGFYSHSTVCLTHQHWVKQVITAGGFNVHCTQAAEASHKINMHLSSLRVRHLDINATQDAMLRYCCNRILFQELNHSLFPDVPEEQKPISSGLYQTIPVEFTRTGDDRNNFRFLHKDVRIVEYELGNLIAGALGMQQDPIPWDHLRKLGIRFAKKLVREDGRTFWADPKRRDIYRLKGYERGCALCAEAICFFQLENLQSIDVHDTNLIDKDFQTFILIRWLSPHPHSVERDQCYRPVCPGPLHINNCLWQYSKTERVRLCMNRPVFTRQRHMFGDRIEDQNNVRLHESHAWYGLVKPENVEETMNMCPVFKRGSSELGEQTWLETVTMF